MGLTPTTTADEMRNIIRGVGLVAALIGLVKFALRRRKKAAQANESYDESPATSSAGAHFVPTAPVGGHDTGPAAPDAGMMQEEAVAVETAPSGQGAGGRRPDRRDRL